MISIFFILTAAFVFPGQPENVPEKTARHFLIGLEKLRVEVQALKDLSLQKGAAAGLKKQFHAARNAYKQIAVLIEYFQPVETKILNRPAIPALKPGTIDEVLPPSGFQFIEQELFAEFGPDSYDYVASLCSEMLETIETLSSQQDLILKFREELVWDAVRSSLVQLMTTGIAGFDSPVAEASLTEACGTLRGMCGILELFNERVNENDLEQIRIRINDAARSIASGKSFRAFDRLEFLKTFADPLYRSLVETRLRSGIKHPEGASGINFDATSLFAGDFFKMDFYGPSPEHGVTPARVRLGKKLFGDPILSGERNRSCASCHDPHKGFSDGLPKPYAIDNKTLLFRNSPTLWNAGLQTRQFWDSRVDLLENQLGEVVHNLQEMQGSLGNAVSDLKESLEYRSLFREAYSEEKENINRFTIANAIASYVRSLRSLDSRFDKYVSGRSNDYSASEKNGFNLFMGKAKCGTCHFLPLFNGLVPPVFYETESEVLGVPATTSKNSPMLDGDRGKFDFTKAEIHRFAFKTPMIRNIALTAPYMHNGVFNTLAEVIDFYDEGGGTGFGIAPPNQTLPPEKLGLNRKEKADLIRFLHSLTDTTAGGISY